MAQPEENKRKAIKSLATIFSFAKVGYPVKTRAIIFVLYLICMQNFHDFRPHFLIFHLPKNP